MYNNNIVYNKMHTQCLSSGCLSVTIKLYSVSTNLFPFCRSSLTDQHMVALATVIRDLDKDYPKGEDSKWTITNDYQLRLKHDLQGPSICSVDFQQFLDFQDPENAG